MSVKRHLLAIFVTLASLVPAVATAQEGAPSAPRRGPHRDGFLIGFGLGAGHIEADCSDCGLTEAGGLDFHIGSMLGPRIGIMFDGWVMAHTEDNLTLSHTIATVAAQLWLLDFLWVKGGIGVAQAAYRWDGVFVDFQDETRLAPAVMVAAGLEFLRGRKFVMDAHLRVGTGFYDTDDSEENGYEVRATSVQVGVGFNWY
jgi:hypothetical protein